MSVDFGAIKEAPPGGVQDTDYLLLVRPGATPGVYCIAVPDGGGDVSAVTAAIAAEVARAEAAEATLQALIPTGSNLAAEIARAEAAETALANALAAEITRAEAAEGGRAANARDYVIGCFQPGTATASEVLFVHVLPHAVVFPAGLAGTGAASLVTAAAQTVYTFYYLRGGVQTTICTLTFAAGASTPTLGAVAVPIMQAGDALVLTAPATPDAQLANIGFSFLAAKE